MPDTTNDIDALLRRVDPHYEFCGFIDAVDCARYHRALSALLAERDALAKDRDALRIELTNAKSFWRPLDERGNTKQRQESDRDLRERLMCAAMQSIAGMSLHGLRWDECGKAVYECADAAIAAMRKETRQ